MTTDINLYKIINFKDFKKELNDKKYVKYSINNDKLSQNEKDILKDVELKLYYSKEFDSSIKWEWVVNKFDVNVCSLKSKPKAVLLIQKGGMYYAISFGYSYHLVGKYADSDWPLEFAERMDFYSIKSVGLLAPNSVINKKIYNYFNYNNLDADIGEALTKITATLNLDKDTLEYLSNYVVIGTSIKFRIKLHNFNSIVNLLEYIERIMLREVKYNLPKLKECKVKEKVLELDKRLIKKIQEDINRNNEEISINISEFTVIGFEYKFFNSEYDSFVFQLNDKSAQFSELTNENIYNFIQYNNLVNENNLLNMDISMFSTDDDYRCTLKDVIMYSDDEYIFNEGIWYEYNSLFFDYIHEYIEDIPVCHLEQYDFPKKEDADKVFDEMRKNKDMHKANYFEYKFNNYIEYTDDKFICLDREKDYMKNQSFEFTDLLDEENHIMYAVKVGNYSNDLSYVIDQSLIGLKALDDGEVENYDKNDVKKVGLWLVFKRKVGYYTITDGKLDWKDMNLLILKSKIADWKKQVLLSGRKPVININYRYD